MVVPVMRWCVVVGDNEKLPWTAMNNACEAFGAIGYVGNIFPTRIKERCEFRISIRTWWWWYGQCRRGPLEESYVAYGERRVCRALG